VTELSGRQARVLSLRAAELGVAGFARLGGGLATGHEPPDPVAERASAADIRAVGTTRGVSVTSIAASVLPR
jgi:hypothetical protein